MQKIAAVIRWASVDLRTTGLREAMVLLVGVLISSPALAIDVVIGPFIADGEHPTLTSAAVEANAYPLAIDVNIVVTPGIPWPGAATISRPVTLESRVPGVQAFLVGSVTFAEGSEGSDVEFIDFQVVVASDSPRITAHTNVKVRKCEFSGLSGSGSGDLGGGIHATADLHVEDSEFHNFSAVGRGGAIQVVAGNVSVVDTVFSFCTAKQGGGAISVDGESDLVIEDSAFLLCQSSDGDGGAVKFTGRNLSISGETVFSSCSATNGGGLWSDAAQSVSMANCQVTGCSSTENGGGFYAKTTLPGACTGVVFARNTAGGDGGALYGDGPLVIAGAGDMTGSTAGGKGGAVCLANGAELMGYSFSLNEAGISGGAVHLTGSNCSLLGGGTMVLIGNVSDGSGGAISTSGSGHLISGVRCEFNDAASGGAIGVGSGSVSLQACVCEENTAGSGGAIYAVGGGSLAMVDCYLNKNMASTGGGLWATSRTLDVVQTEIALNLVSLGAGGVYLSNCTGTARTMTVRRHDSPGNGGGLLLVSCNLMFDECHILQNTAEVSGGGMFIEGGSLEMKRGSIRENYAQVEGGGLWAHADAVALNGTLVDANAGLWGGGLYLLDGNTTLFEATIEGNVASFGGGLACQSGDLRLESATFIYNEAQEDGGGLHLASWGEVVSHESTFTSNTASLRGGGAFIAESQATFFDTGFHSSLASQAGGGLCSISSMLWMERCMVAGNWSGYGGGMHAVGGGSVSLLDTSVQNNISGDDAGGISIGSNTLLIADRLRLLANSLSEESTGTGSALFGGQKILMTNSLIAGNGTSHAIRTAGELRMGNSTFANNLSGIQCIGSTTSSIVNSILWDNSGSGIVGADVVFSCVEGGILGEGNIDSDPQFVDPATMNFSLQFSSPCFDAAKDGYVMQDELDSDIDGDVSEYTPLDLPGNARVMGAAVDMGAYEVPVDTPSCGGDIDGSGAVDIDDMLAVIGGWGTPDGDVTGDGATDISDLLLVLEFFGPCE